MDFHFDFSDLGEDVPEYDRVSVGSIRGSVSTKALEQFARGEAPLEVYEQKSLRMLKSEAMLLHCASEGDIESIAKGDSNA